MNALLLAAASLLFKEKHKRIQIARQTTPSYGREISFMAHFYGFFSLSHSF
jgi:hypothetical protein